MKQVDVYEVSRTIHTLAGSYDQISIHELRHDGGRAWGNPGGGDTFVRYDLPVTHVVEERTEDGFTHRRDSYVAIGPRLLELLTPAVSNTLSDRLRSEKLRADRLAEEMRRLAGDAAGARASGVMQAEVAQQFGRRIGNFREASLLRRIWRAIRRDI